MKNETFQGGTTRFVAGICPAALWMYVHSRRLPSVVLRFEQGRCNSLTDIDLCFYIPEPVGTISVTACAKMTVLHFANGAGLPRYTSLLSKFRVHVVPILCLLIGFMHIVNILVVYFIVTVMAVHVVGLLEASKTIHPPTWLLSTCVHVPTCSVWNRFRVFRWLTGVSYCKKGQKLCRNLD
jgi:hypothetical protein